MKNYLLIFILITFNGCVSKDEYTLFKQAKLNPPPASERTLHQLNNMQFEYKILPHDRVSVMVYKHPDLSTGSINNLQQERGLLVNSRGDIRLPLIKNIHLAGLTQTEAESRIESAFGTYLKHPDVQIEVLNKRAYVVGEVNRPGEIELVNEQLPLLHLLAKAGDLTNQADRKSILIMRGGNRTNVRTEMVNLTDAYSLSRANLMIKPNDVVYVMPNKMKAFNNRIEEMDPIFRLIGHVLQPFVNVRVLTR